MYLQFQASSARFDAGAGAALPTSFQAERQPVSSATVLLVEDEPSVRRLCALLLERAGHSVLQARHAADAIHLSENFARPIHLLVTDVVLPDSDGRELALRLAAARPELAVLLLSGYPEQIAAAASPESAFPRFLAKPFSSADFLTCVRGLLDRKPAA